MQCNQCSSTCGTCSGPGPQECITCNATFPFYFQPNSSCLADCPTGYMQNNRLAIPYKRCEQCHPTCETCSRSGADNCLSCMPAFPYLFPPNNTCSDHCPPNYYINSSTNTCEKCLDPFCSQCDPLDPYKCLQCLHGSLKYLFNNTCIHDCPHGFFGNNNTQTCDLCDSTCDTCADTAAFCTKCNGTFYLYQNQCLTECPAGFYKNFSNNECTPCIINCLECMDGTH